MDNVSYSPDVHNFKSGISRSFNPDHLGVGFDCCGHFCGVRSVHKGRLDPHVGRHFAEISICTSIKVVHGHNMVAVLQHHGDGRGRGQSGAERDGIGGPVQGG